MRQKPPKQKFKHSKVNNLAKVIKLISNEVGIRTSKSLALKPSKPQATGLCYIHVDRTADFPWPGCFEGIGSLPAERTLHLVQNSLSFENPFPQYIIPIMKGSQVILAEREKEARERFRETDPPLIPKVVKEINTHCPNRRWRPRYAQTVIPNIIAFCLAGSFKVCFRECLDPQMKNLVSHTSVRKAKAGMR